MDHVADSDTENSLPLLCVSDVDTASVRSVFALFSHDTRCRLRAEAHNTPFAALYEEHPPDLTQNGSLDYADPQEHTQAHTQEHTPTSALSPEPVLAEPWREPDTHIPPTTSQPQTIHVLSSQAAPADISLAKPTQNSGGRASRSLRKRTFASRHPYIADQADWLGICTVESINEMFDGDEEISRVVRALNHLYLQKKKRYPDEDRYRSKDFYTHLGHSKSLALQGDADAVEDENGDLRQIQHQDSASQDEHNYDPDAHSSQIDHSADDEDEDDEDRLIPYDEFAYPYSQDHVSPSQTEIASETFKHPNDHNGLHGTPQFQEYNDSSEDDSAEDAPDSPQQEEEEYIKIGGKYRKLRTILRGVLPESAKRLGIFERTSPVKRRKKITRTLTPRKGLAMKKHGSSVSNSAELERELFSRAPQDPGEAPLRRSSVQPTISESSILRFERPTSSRPVPSLSRNSTSFTYISDTPEPQYIDSCSDSETEGLGVETLGQGRISTLSNPPSLSLSRSSTLGLSHSPHNSYPQSHKNPSDINNQWRIPLDEPFDQGYAQEFDEIDHLLAPRGNKPGRTVKGLSSNGSNGSNSSNGLGSNSSSGLISKRSSTSAATKKIPTYIRGKNSGLSQRRLNLPKVPIGRPAATQQRRQRNGASNPRRSQVLEKIQTRLPAFRDSLRQEKRASGKTLGSTPGTKATIKPKSKPTPHSNTAKAKTPAKTPAKKDAPFQQYFKRAPTVSTSVIEIESSRKTVGASAVAYDSVIQRFQPTRQFLLGSATTTSANSLTGLDDVSSVSALRDGRMFFPNEDTLSIMFLGKAFSFALYSPGESSKNLSVLLTSLKRLLASPKLLLKPEVRADTHSALRAVIKWFFICRERPTATLLTQMRSILNEFSKLQIREVRVLQISIQSQLLYLFWVLIQLEHNHQSGQEEALINLLQGYTSDFFVIFFRTFTAEDLSSAYAKESPTHDLFESVMLIFTVFEKSDKCWWPPMVQAIDDMVLFGNEITSILDLTYLLGAIISKKYFNWGPFMVILNKMKTSVDSLGHRHFIETCELIHQRLEWPLEEKILIQLYGVFGGRKFSNFSDESNIPFSVGVVHSRADIPQGSVFERFLGLLYLYISELSSAKEVKRLMSKLLASSQYHYVRGRKSQIMFANRLNLILLLSQISDVDLGRQFTNLVTQVAASADPFVYGRSLDALSVFCEVSATRNTVIPFQAFVVLFKALASATKTQGVMSSLFQKLVDLMAQTFRGSSPEVEGGIFGLLQILSVSDLSNIPESFILEVLGTVFLSIMEVELIDSELSNAQARIVAEFQKSLLKLLGSRMERLPASKKEEDQSVEETVELGIQIWMLSSKISRSLHWNNMMYSRYSYLGNSISRNRFVMFFCLEFMQYGTVDSFVLQEIEKIFLNGLVSPNLSKYSVDLYRSLIQNPNSVFWSKESSIPEITSLVSLQSFRLRILTRLFETIVGSQTLHGNEKSGIISGFVKRLHDVYTDHHHEQGVTDLCKRVTETVQRVAKNYVASLDEFWELSTKLGFPNKNIQNKWSTSDDKGKVQLLNTEFVSALAYGKDYIVAIDNWKTEKNDLILYALVQVYVSALTVSSAYWAHLSLLLEYLVAKVETFSLMTNVLPFKKLLSLLKEVSLMSNYRNDSRYILHELKALQACTRILHHTLFVFDGYKDKQDITHIIYEFIANIDLGCPKRYKISAIFMDVSIEMLQNTNNVSYHPKHQHTKQEYSEAFVEVKHRLESLTNVASGVVPEKAKAYGITDFEFF